MRLTRYFPLAQAREIEGSFVIEKQTPHTRLAQACPRLVPALLLLHRASPMVHSPLRRPSLLRRLSLSLLRRFSLSLLRRQSRLRQLRLSHLRVRPRLAHPFPHQQQWQLLLR